LIGCEARARSLLSQASRARVHKPGDVGDARDIADELTAMGVVLSLGGSTYDPTDPVGRLLFNVLGMVAEFEAGACEPAREWGCRQSGGATESSLNYPRPNGSIF
jgi:hypothetical protein